MSLAGSVLLAALSATPARAPAEVETAHAEERFAQALRGDIGLFSAIGNIGSAYSFEPVRLLLVEIGTGVGGSGLQLSLMPKLVLGAGSHRFTPGVGISVGLPAGSLGIQSRSTPRDRIAMPWLNADLLAYDYRSRTGWSFVVAAGLTVALRHGCVVIDSCTDMHGQPLPQMRLGFGHWF